MGKKKIFTLQDIKYQNLCFKCSVGRHSQHSDFTGTGNSHGLWLEALQNDKDICTCPECWRDFIL